MSPVDRSTLRADEFLSIEELQAVEIALFVCKRYEGQYPVHRQRIAAQARVFHLRGRPHPAERPRVEWLAHHAIVAIRNERARELQQQEHGGEVDGLDTRPGVLIQVDTDKPHRQ